MAGALIQLVACGAEDHYLTDNPMITYFKVGVRRHTNFASESIEQTVTGTANFGGSPNVTIGRNGDLITKLIVKAELPEVNYSGDVNNRGHVQFAWVKNVGHALIQEYKLNIGGQDISVEYGDWLQMWADVSLASGLQPALDRMIGNVPELTELSSLNWEDDTTLLKDAYTLYVPLKLYFTESNNLALPLIALQYHEVKIFLKLRHASELYIASDAFIAHEQRNRLALEGLVLYADYIFLDNVERRKFASGNHEYLITVVQSTGEESITGSSGRFRLNFNHPSKAIYWVVKMGNYRGGRFSVYAADDWEKARQEAAERLLLAQFDIDEFGFVQAPSDDCYEDQGISYCAIDPADPSFEPTFVFNDGAVAALFDGNLRIGRLAAGTPLLARGSGRDSFDLASKVDGTIRITLDPQNNNDIKLSVDKVTRNDLTIAHLSIPIDKFTVDNRNLFTKSKDVVVWQHDNYGLLIDGSINPSTEVEFQLNGQPRQSKRSGDWYDTVVPYYVHSRVPKKRGLCVFAFSIRPENPMPDGSMNMSRIETASLNLWFGHFSGHNMADVFVNQENKVYVMTRSYNILRMISGMAGLAYN
jgi:hypothetical protein